MTSPRNAWWITLAVLLAPALYLCYWVRQMTIGQTPRMDTIALSVAESPELWEHITLGGEHPVQVYQEMREVNEYMLVASTLTGALIIVAAAVLAGGWIMARRRAAQSG